MDESKRKLFRQHLSQRLFDLVIIGGGINGASIARDAALRGYSVALFEQEDFGFGTSSRSSRLIHGGLRYLEHGKVRLVFESLSERTCLARMARHLVRPLPFVFPAYTGQQRLITLELGLWIYDALAMFRNYRAHEDLTVDEVSEHIAGIQREGLKGGVLYYDYQTNDARLVLENILAAQTAEAQVFSYAEVEAVERSTQKPHTIWVRDKISGERFSVPSRVIICAAGPWTDHVLALMGESAWLQPTKGVHLVLSPGCLPLKAALVMRHPRDARILFAIPDGTRTIIGTTDTDFTGDPKSITTTSEDVDYLLQAARYYFPRASIAAKDIISTWAGVRPLLKQGEVKNPSAVSREHKIATTPDGLAIIAGGKLTTYRRMASECMEEVTKLIAMRGGRLLSHSPNTHRLPLPGAEGITNENDLEQLIQRISSEIESETTARHLVHIYGTRVLQLIPLLQENPLLATSIDEALPNIWAEVVFAARMEMALSIADVFQRRTQIFYSAPDQGLSIAQSAAALLARELGWDAAEESRQVQKYHEMVKLNRSWMENNNQEEFLKE